MEEKRKVCFRCGVEKPLSEYYKHKQMGDGHLNKCKECTRGDTNKNEKEHRKDPLWVEKERERGREKYHRLGYKGKYATPAFRNNHEYKNLNRKLRSASLLSDGMEIHHWNYNEMYNVFIMDISTHRSLHRKIKLDNDLLLYRTNNGVLLDTVEKHLTVIRMLFEDVIHHEDVSKFFVRNK